MLDTCPFCSHKDADIYKKAQTLREPQAQPRDFYKCRECNIIYPRPRQDAYENLRYLEAMDADIKEAKDPAMPFSRSHYMVRLLERFKKVDNVKRALDIGTYTGRLCYIMESLGIDSYGLEPQKKAVEYARTKGLKVYNGFFPEEVPAELKDIKFDLISASECVYYFADLKKALIKIYNMLSEKGVIFLQFHQAKSHYYSGGHSLFSRYGDYVQGIPTAESLSYCLANVGFKIRELQPVPDQYLSVMLGLDKDKAPIIHRVFNRIYGTFFLDRKKWIEIGDRIIIIAQK